MKAREFGLSRMYNGAWVLTATLTADSVKDAQRLIDSQKDRDYEVTVREYRERRTLIGKLPVLSVFRGDAGGGCL